MLVCPDDLAQQYKPLSCLAREAAQRNWKPLALLLLSGLGALYFWRRRRRQQALVKAAEALYEKVRSFSVCDGRVVEKLSFPAILSSLLHLTSRGRGLESISGRTGKGIRAPSPMVSNIRLR